MIALAGTPRVWQEVSKLLAVAQHRAQVKFWSMVLPGERESGQGELIAAVDPMEFSSAEDASTCPLQRGASRENQALSNSKQNRRTIPAAIQSQSRARTENAPASHAGLMARALKAQHGDAESLLRSRTAAWVSPSPAIAANDSALLVLPNAATLPHQPASKSDTFRFVLMPPASPVTSSLVEREAVMQFKLMRKSLEAGKLLRQKGRLPVSGGTAAFPAS
jgi:hypothetical protein